MTATRILVTGGAGFVGSPCVRTLLGPDRPGDVAPSPARGARRPRPGTRPSRIPLRARRHRRRRPCRLRGRRTHRIVRCAAASHADRCGAREFVTPNALGTHHPLAVRGPAPPAPRPRRPPIGRPVVPPRPRPGRTGHPGAPMPSAPAGSPNGSCRCAAAGPTCGTGRTPTTTRAAWSWSARAAGPAAGPSRPTRMRPRAGWAGPRSATRWATGRASDVRDRARRDRGGAPPPGAGLTRWSARRVRGPRGPRRTGSRCRRRRGAAAR